MSIINKILNFKDNKELKKMQVIVKQINALEPNMRELKDQDFPQLTQRYRERIAAGESLDSILPEVYATCREAASRTIGLRHFDVQLLGGLALHDGNVAEMKTGEGKTLVATLPAYLNALTGEGVHIVTVNDYLAKRDSEWMGQVFNFLGLTVGCIINGSRRSERKAAYQCDITYGTNNEFGFDYLRDNMAISIDQVMQRNLNYAIIDEADSILIDEARTPLIISGESNQTNTHYQQANEIVRKLHPEDYVVEEDKRTVTLTDIGAIIVEAFFDIANLADLENIEIYHRVMQALKAHKLMKKDVDYIVSEGQVLIVDEFTGRLMPGRRFNEGLHQAIEAKEELEIKKENQTLATITLQNYFRMYQKLAGMTGTAKTEESELLDIYNMSVIEIPTNKPINRDDKEDVVYMTEREKLKAIVERITECYQQKRPVLVGTISVEKSEQLSKLLEKSGIPHNVLNAKHHEREAEIVAEAGCLGAVTIATNMAGRGTDILLGGNPDHMIKNELKKSEGLDEAEYQLAKEHITHMIHNTLDLAYKKVVELGGLYIIGTDRHEARRIDNQLRGRAGRQGDPGTTEFFLSLEDDLLRMFGGEQLKSICAKIGAKEGQPIKSRILSQTIESAQKKVEGRNFTIRKYILQYDNVSNNQREVMYGERNKVLHGENLQATIWSMMNGIIQGLVDEITSWSKYPESWDTESLFSSVHSLYEEFNPPQLSKEEKESLSKESLMNMIMDQIDFIYALRESEIGEAAMRALERKILLSILDYKWIEHIDEMEQFKSGIGLRAIGQEDPAKVYAVEGYEMFQQMIKSMEEEVTALILKKHFINIEIV